MKVTLTKVMTFNKDKNGLNLKTKDGKPYTRVVITTKEHGDKQLSGFQNNGNMAWKEGDVVEIEVEEKGEYLNFKNSSGGMKEVLERLSRVEEKIESLSNNNGDIHF